MGPEAPTRGAAATFLLLASIPIILKTHNPSCDEDPDPEFQIEGLTTDHNVLNVATLRALQICQARFESTLGMTSQKQSARILHT